jgi:hypothetical protein
MNDITSALDGASGRFVLRIEPELHAALRRRADAAGLSLNAFCARKLAAPDPTLDGPLAEAVERCLALFDEALVGIVVYGSWPRGELATTSDVDILVVVDRSVPILRAIYREWDALPPIYWGSHSVEPHFVHLPDSDDETAGTWAEAAIDGLVIYDRGLAVSQRLAAFRRRIADGELERRWVHGQPYWVEAA